MHEKRQCEQKSKKQQTVKMDPWGHQILELPDTDLKSYIMFKERKKFEKFGR